MRKGLSECRLTAALKAWLKLLDTKKRRFHQSDFTQEGQMKPRITTRAIAVGSVAALALAAPVGAIAAASHQHGQPATVTRLDRSPDRHLRDSGKTIDRSDARTHGSSDMLSG